VNIGWGNGVSADEAVSGVNADAVLVPVVADAVLFDPSSVKIFLPQALWLVGPSIWQLPALDGFVLRP
jgi:hypothetical protein